MSVRKIIVRGSKQLSLPVNAADPLQHKESYLLSGTNRAAGESHEISLKEDDVVEMIFNDDTTWFCNPDTIEDVFPEATTSNRSGNTSFVLPAGLSGAEENRGIIGDVVLKALNIFSK